MTETSTVSAVTAAATDSGLDAAVRVATHDGERRRAGGLEMTRRLEDGVVLDGAHHQVTSAFRAPALEHAANRQVVRLGAGSGEDDLALRASEHRGEPVPGRVDRRARRPPRLVHR